MASSLQTFYLESNSETYSIKKGSTLKSFKFKIIKIYATVVITQFLSSLPAHGQEYEPEDLIIDSIECVGNTNTDCEIIKKEFYIKPGEKINEEEIQNARIRLQLLNLFKSIDITLQKGIEKGHVVIRTEVIEDNPIFFETSLGVNLKYLSSRSMNNLALAFGHRNLFGKGKQLKLEFEPIKLFDRKDELIGGGLEYIDPHLFDQQKLFLITKIMYYFQDVSRTSKYLNTSNKSLMTFAALGYRIFYFSYLKIGTESSKTNLLVRDTESEPFQDYINSSQRNFIGYGWNNENDNLFPTDGSNFDFNYSWSNSKKDSNLTNLRYKQNFSIAKNILTLDFRSYYASSQLYNELGGNAGLSWAYQLRRNLTESAITDSRIYISTKYSYNNFSDYINDSKVISFGAVLNAKDYGVINLNAFYMVPK